MPVIVGSKYIAHALYLTLVLFSRTILWSSPLSSNFFYDDVLDNFINNLKVDLVIDHVVNLAAFKLGKKGESDVIYSDICYKRMHLFSQHLLSTCYNPAHIRSAKLSKTCSPSLKVVTVQIGTQTCKQSNEESIVEVLLTDFHLPDLWDSLTVFVSLKHNNPWSRHFEIHHSKIFIEFLHTCVLAGSVVCSLRVSCTG